MGVQGTGCCRRTLPIDTRSSCVPGLTCKAGCLAILRRPCYLHGAPLLQILLSRSSSVSFATTAFLRLYFLNAVMPAFAWSVHCKLWICIALYVERQSLGSCVFAQTTPCQQACLHPQAQALPALQKGFQMMVEVLACWTRPPLP